MVSRNQPVDHQPPTITISGYVREAGSQEALIGVNVYRAGNKPLGTTTNTYGFYSLTVPADDSLRLVYSMVGYDTQEQTIPGQKTQIISVLLRSGKLLNEVVVRSSRAEEKVSDSPQMSQIDIPISQIKKIPALLGEKDVLKVLQLMPGVQKGSEGQSGIYVRGGGPDQNLIVLDDAVVYNASHLFGFFSVFNGDALKSVELTKGGFPARFGGRLSSVIDLNMKDGNKEKLHGEGGIGLIASFLLLDDPTSAQKVRWEDNVTAGRGWSYGAEVLLQKKVGRFSGWVSYTLSWTQWQFAELNGGKPFYPRYDRRHDISVVGIYELSPKITLSGTWVYGTGQALTLPQARYSAYGQGNPSYSYGPQGQTTVLPYGNSQTATEYGIRRKKQLSGRTVSPVRRGRTVSQKNEAARAHLGIQCL